MKLWTSSRPWQMATLLIPTSSGKFGLRIVRQLYYDLVLSRFLIEIVYHIGYLLLHGTSVLLVKLLPFLPVFIPRSSRLAVPCPWRCSFGFPLSIAPNARCVLNIFIGSVLLIQHPVKDFRKMPSRDE
ncbi:hypothetical protein CRYUN_Cryun36dG0109500 [Craigia yunnanensis]